MPHRRFDDPELRATIKLAVVGLVFFLIMFFGYLFWPLW